MGLDQHATARKGEPTRTEREVEYTDLDGKTHKQTEVDVIYEDQMQLAYWRKHPNLQGWMENLWREKGGEGEFNCVDVELTAADLEQLETSIEGKELPATEGFFFGSGSDDYYKEGDLEFIREARAAIKQGYTVIYNSWW